MSFNYHIYGLNIRSSRQIDLLVEKTNSIVDLSVIWLTDTSFSPMPDLIWEQINGKELNNRKLISFFSAETAEGLLYKVCFKNETGEMSLLLGPDKKNLWLIYDKMELDSNLDSYFVGVIMGCVLRLRGIICLHASVVNIEGKAVLFLGKKRSGKSTTAAAFAKLGFKVLSDDIAVTTYLNNEFYIQPGYTKIRLRPKSLAAIHSSVIDNFPSVFSHRDSRYVNIEENFQDEILPVKAVYLLSEASEINAKPYIEPVLGESIIRLHENIFASYIITPNIRRKEFEILSLLALHTPIRRLRFGNNVELVNLQCQAVIKDIAQLNNSNHD